jgi:DNA-binding SARP family transcriptional activator/predicted ATPase
MSSLRISLFGVPRIQRGAEAISIQRRKALALLAYLAVTGQPHSRDTLATLLWPDHDQSGARANLRRDLSRLKQDLGGQALVIDREQIGLNPELEVWLDVNAFQSGVARVQGHECAAPQLCPECLAALKEAVDLYTGDFMAGFTLSDSAEFDDWQFFQAESLRQELASALEQLVLALTAQEEYGTAIPYARRWLALDPLHGPAQSHLMQLYAGSAQLAAALRQYEEYVRLLDAELGLPPEEEITTLYEAIKAKRILKPFLKTEVPVSGLQSEPPTRALWPGRDKEAQLEQDTTEPPAPTPPLPRFLRDDSVPPDAEVPLFVAREQELAQLNGVLDLALAGQGQVAFVVGDAGRGKTVLVQEFIRRAQEGHTNLVVAGGNCNAYTGTGDPYLPFREILGLLTGDVEARWAAGAISRDHAQRLWNAAPQSAQAVVEIGPDLVDIFVPGPALVTRATAAIAGEADWLIPLKHLVTRNAADRVPASVQQSDLFEQYVKVILSLADRQPLLLVLDDLQWADSGSISLLFHLGRRLAGSRVVVVGIYRPDDVALGRDGQRHPLEPLVHEFQRQFGDIIIDLRQSEGQHFVEAFLATEPNDLGPAFLEALYLHTRGHALFTSEMLRGLQERGDLIKDERGRWIEGTTLNWEILPARIEGVIGERIARLPQRLQEALKVACVEGEAFTAEVVARAQTVDEREMVRQLSGELDKQHRLIRGQGTQRLGVQRLSHYRFRHILFQRYMYNSLDEVERDYLHEAVGNELERLYGDQTEEVAVALARHFERAGLVSKAVHYLHQAGSRAVRLSANEEALGHLFKALALLKTLPRTTETYQQELSLQIALFAPLAAIKGYGAPELGSAYHRARELCEKVNDPDQLFLVLYGLWGHNLVRSELQTSRDLAAECLALAQRVDKQAFLMEAHRMTDESAFYRGEFARAREHFERSLAIYDRQQHRAHADIYGQDPGVALLSHGCCILWHLGYPDQALKRSREAIALGEEQAHPFSLAFALCYSAMMYQYRREPQVVKELADAAISLSTEQGFVFWLAQASFLRGWALVEEGQTAEGIAQMRQGLADWRATGTEFLVGYTTGLLAEAYGRMGRVEEGLVLLEEAFAMVSQKDQGLYEAELHRLKGELLLKQVAPEAEIEEQFRRAIEVARQRGAKSQELRATMSLCRLWQGQGAEDKVPEDRAMLAELYGWFTEGFNTADLKEARALLEKLGGDGKLANRGKPSLDPQEKLEIAEAE